MSDFIDLEDMIEVLGLAIVRQETEEQFFRRSANHSTSEASKSLFTEIADELAAYVKSLEGRKQKLLDALSDLTDKQKLAKTTKRGNLTRDPVCGMKIEPDKCKLVSTYQGREYRFCSEDCKKAFDVAPGKYVEQ